MSGAEREQAEETAVSAPQPAKKKRRESGLLKKVRPAAHLLLVLTVALNAVRQTLADPDRRILRSIRRSRRSWLPSEPPLRRRTAPHRSRSSATSMLTAQPRQPPAAGTAVAVVGNRFVAETQTQHQVQQPGGRLHSGRVAQTLWGTTELPGRSRGRQRANSMSQAQAVLAAVQQRQAAPLQLSMTLTRSVLLSICPAARARVSDQRKERARVAAKPRRRRL